MFAIIIQSDRVNILPMETFENGSCNTDIWSDYNTGIFTSECGNNTYNCCRFNGSNNLNSYYLHSIGFNTTNMYNITLSFCVELSGFGRRTEWIEFKYSYNDNITVSQMKTFDKLAPLDLAYYLNNYDCRTNILPDYLNNQSQISLGFKINSLNLRVSMIIDNIVITGENQGNSIPTISPTLTPTILPSIGPTMAETIAYYTSYPGTIEMNPTNVSNINPTIYSDYNTTMIREYDSNIITSIISILISFGVLICCIIFIVLSIRIHNYQKKIHGSELKDTEFNVGSNDVNKLPNHNIESIIKYDSEGVQSNASIDNNEGIIPNDTINDIIIAEQIQYNLDDIHNITSDNPNRNDADLINPSKNITILNIKTRQV